MTCTSSKVPRSNLTSCILWKSAALQSFMASTIQAHRAAPCCGDFQKGNAVSVIAEPIDVTILTHCPQVLFELRAIGKTARRDERRWHRKHGQVGGLPLCATIPRDVHHSLASRTAAVLGIRRISCSCQSSCLSGYMTPRVDYGRFPLH